MQRLYSRGITKNPDGRDRRPLLVYFFDKQQTTNDQQQITFKPNPNLAHYHQLLASRKGFFVRFGSKC